METKRFGGSVELKADDQGSVRATFSTLNTVDLDGDVTLPGAFTENEAVKIARWGHNWGDLPVGRGAIHADAQAAWMDGTFFLDTIGGQDTYKTVKHLGELQEWSYGFDILDAEFGKFAGQDVRFLKRLRVFEVSPVMLGAGVGTRTDSIKGYGLNFEEHSERVQVALAELLERVKSGIDSRVKEGRAISNARRARMGVVAGQLRDAAGEIDALLKETEPAKAGDLARLRFDFERTSARLERELGVPAWASTQNS